MKTHKYTKDIIFFYHKIIKNSKFHIKKTEKEIYYTKETNKSLFIDNINSKHIKKNKKQKFLTPWYHQILKKFTKVISRNNFIEIFCNNYKFKLHE